MKTINRRKAIGGILGIVGTGLTYNIAFNNTSENASYVREKLEVYINLIGDLVETIIPETSTAGAKIAGVQEYIIDYMENCSSTKEYKNFYYGLRNLQQTSLNRYNCVFEDCSKPQKLQLLMKLDSQWNSKGILLKISNRLHGRSFFNMLKTLTVEGYCTSEIGATEHLAYQPIPGRYNAVTELMIGQKAWATR